MSSARPRNCTYSSEAGQVLYKVDKPSSLDDNGTATIAKHTGEVNGTYQSGSANTKLHAGELPLSEGHFTFYAQIEFHTWRSSRFRFNGHSISVDDYFRKDGSSISLSRYGHDRVFTASDGKEYRWQLGAETMNMVRNDGRRTRVVEYKEYVPTIGPFKGQPGSLVIDGSCLSILDEIILTFIYCEKLWTDRRVAAEVASAGT